MRNFDDLTLKLFLDLISGPAFRYSLISCGSLIESLDLSSDDDDQFFLDESMLILPASCPNIVSSRFRQRAIFQEDSFSPPLLSLFSHHFINLKSLTWTGCSHLSSAEFILVHDAHNI